MNALKNLFKEAGVKDVITLFHSPSNPASMRVHSILKQVTANAQSHATEDQASDHDAHNKLQRKEFKLDVEEGPPTTDQLNSILEYLGPSKAGSVIADATGSSDALRKFKQSAASFKRPVVVDWGNGRAVAGDDESEILKLLKTTPKESDKA